MQVALHSEKFSPKNGVRKMMRPPRRIILCIQNYRYPYVRRTPYNENVGTVWNAYTHTVPYVVFPTCPAKKTRNGENSYFHCANLLVIYPTHWSKKQRLLLFKIIKINYKALFWSLAVLNLQNGKCCTRCGRKNTLEKNEQFCFKNVHHFWCLSEILIS